MVNNHEYSKKILHNAHKLRHNMTKEEVKLWNILRNRRLMNLKFRRQVPIGKYIADFLCVEKGLIIEIDGGQHNEPDKIIYDKERSDYFQEQGYRVIRFWNDEVWNNIEGVIEKIIYEAQR